MAQPRQDIESPTFAHEPCSPSENAANGGIKGAGMTEHKTHQLTVLVEPSLREAIDKARGNLTMGRFVRDAIADKIAGPDLLDALEKAYDALLVTDARGATAIVVEAIYKAKQAKGDQDVDWEVRS